MSTKSYLALVAAAVLWSAGCPAPEAIEIPVKTSPLAGPESVSRIQNPGKVIHVLVALCDNENQGIVPVPAHLGNGEDPAGNLYWGAAFGVRTFFSKSPNWEKIAEIEDPKADVLQRIVFKRKTGDT